MRAGCWRGVKGVGCSGHHGIDVSFGASNLVTRFDIQTRFVHDISVEWFALGTVFANGKGEDLNLDMHRYALGKIILTAAVSPGFLIWQLHSMCYLLRHLLTRQLQFILLSHVGPISVHLSMV